MKLLITGLNGVINYFPTDPTYAIRIASKPEDLSLLRQAKDSQTPGKSYK